MSCSKLRLNIKEKKIILCAVLSGMMMLTTGFTRTSIPTSMHQVTISVDGGSITTNTTHTSPDFILARAGVKLSGRDEYHLEKVDDTHTTITVYRAVPVTVSYNGQTTEVMTAKRTVGDALIELGYNLEDIDSPQGLDTKIQENLNIVVTDSTRKLEELQRKREQQQRVNTPSGSAHYRAVYNMEATAYLPGDGNGSGITATGMVATRGVVAVDPGVIPLGTRVYIPGYGEAVAGDTGGAIRGNRVDLCMESYGEAMQFGRRAVEVYILD